MMRGSVPAASEDIPEFSSFVRSDGFVDTFEK